MRYVFLFIVLAHGFIHLMGFVKAFDLGNIEQLSGKTVFALSVNGIKAAGVLWLVVCVLFVGTALLYLLHQSSWWIPTVVAVCLSQALVILYWPDAKFGTIANVIILCATLVGYGQWQFNRMVDRELASFTVVQPEEKVITEHDIQNLPLPVQKWLTYAGVINKEIQQTIHFQQTGEMRTAPDGKWMHVAADQYIRTSSPGFIWKANVQMMPGIYLSGRDKYVDGNGAMLIKLLSLVPVADAEGPETDQGALLRYLGEMVWYPSAALEDYITWEAIDAKSAKATMTYGDVTASGIFHFNEEGQVVSFRAPRYYNREGGATLEDWLVEIDATSYTSFQDIRVPQQAAVTWKLKEGDFTWYKLSVDQVVYNSF